MEMKTGVASHVDLPGTPQQEQGPSHHQNKEPDGAIVDVESGSKAEQKDRRHEEDWLFSEGAAWNFREIMQLKRVLVIAFLGLIYASWHPMTLLNMANEGGVTWISSLPISISVAFGTFLVMSLVCFIAYRIIRGDKHNWWWLLCSVFCGLTYLTECLTIAKTSPTFYAPFVSGMFLFAVLFLTPGKRTKYTVQSCALIYFSVVPLIVCRSFLPPLFCITDSIDPLVSSSVYPLIVSAYEGAYLPLVFYVWNFSSRRDCPELSLSFQVGLFHALGEAMFCGGLIQGVYRLSGAQLTRYVAVAIFGRCFGKLANRSGFWECTMSRLWPNKMNAHRDLIGRHAHGQYCYCFLFVALMALCGFAMFLFQAFSGRHAPTPFTNVSLYMALLTNAFMALLTEIGVAALTFAQRRQVVSRSGVGAMTLWESFWAMHQAGMQPYCTTLRGLFDPRHAAERTFEQRVREPGVTAAAHFLIRLTQKDCVIIATVIFAFGSGPYSQAIGVMMTSGTAPCG